MWLCGCGPCGLASNSGARLNVCRRWSTQLQSEELEMKDHKLERLFCLAKSESAPPAGLGFESRVMRAIRQEAPTKPISLLDQLNALFPGLSLACAIGIILCITTDVVLTSASGT